MPDPGYAEEPAVYAFQVTMTAGQSLKQQKVNIDPDSDFLLTGIHGTATGGYSVNYLLPSGRPYANVPIQSANLIGTANQPTAIGPAQLYRAAGVGPSLDLTDTSGAGNTLEICFSGIRRYKI